MTDGQTTDIINTLNPWQSLFH